MGLRSKENFLKGVIQKNTAGAVAKQIVEKMQIA